MKRGPNAAVLLQRALATSASRAGVRFTAHACRSVPWHSATFAGARHVIEGEASEGAEAWAATLGDEDLPLPGHLVADTRVTIRRVGDAAHLALEAVTVALE